MGIGLGVGDRCGSDGASAMLALRLDRRSRHQRFFDSIDRELLLRAVRKHTQCRWVVLYIERWLKAPAMLEDGTLVPRDRGTPQGGVVSPMLANLFLHYVFDVWIGRTFPVPFERYADDVICHCRSEREALALRRVLDRRLPNVGWCSIQRRRRWSTARTPTAKGNTRTASSTFSAIRFRPRRAKWRGELYGLSFLPAASPKALKAIRQAIRGWSLQTRSDKALDDLAADVQPVHPRLDQLLQSFLQIGTVSDASSDRRLSGSVGTPQVQAPEATAKGRARLAGTGGPVNTGSFRSLAASVWTRAEHWEPYELRGSRTVLGARGGEIPPRDSLAAVPPERDSGAGSGRRDQPGDDGRMGDEGGRVTDSHRGSDAPGVTRRQFHSGR